MQTQHSEDFLPEHELLARMLEQAKGYARRYGLHVVLAIGIVIVATTVVRTRAANRAKHLAQEWRTVTDLPETVFVPYNVPEAEQRMKVAMQSGRALLQDMPETKATPWLRLKLAHLEAFGGQWDAAASSYEQVMQRYEGTQAAEIARIARASVLEQKGEYAEAAGLFEQAAETGLPRHLFDAARCRELAGDADGARRQYEAYLASENVNENLRRLAEGRIADIAAGEPLSTPPTPKPLEMKQPEAEEPTLTPEADTAAPVEPEPDPAAQSGEID